MAWRISVQQLVTSDIIFRGPGRNEHPDDNFPEYSLRINDRDYLDNLDGGVRSGMTADNDGVQCFVPVPESITGRRVYQWQYKITGNGGDQTGNTTCEKGQAVLTTCYTVVGNEGSTAKPCCLPWAVQDPHGGCLVNSPCTCSASTCAKVPPAPPFPPTPPSAPPTPSPPPSPPPPSPSPSAPPGIPPWIEPDDDDQRGIAMSPAVGLALAILIGIVVGGIACGCVCLWCMRRQQQHHQLLDAQAAPMVRGMPPVATVSSTAGDRLSGVHEQAVSSMVRKYPSLSHGLGPMVRPGEDLPDRSNDGGGREHSSNRLAPEFAL